MAKSKVNFAVNVFGLAIGLACCILVVLFVRNELTYDQFHPQASQIYRPYMIEQEEDQTRINTVTPGPLGPTVIGEVPEIKEYCIVGQFTDLVKKGNEPIQETIYTVSPSFFKVFGFEVISGSVDKVFEAPEELVLTESMAKKYFGKEEAVGKTLQVHVGEEYRDFVVRAVTKDTPPNSSFQYDFLVSEENNKRIYPPRMLRSWFAIFNETYFLLEEGADPKIVEEKIVPVMAQVFGENTARRRYEVKLQAMTEIHLDTELPPGIAQVSDPMYSYVLGSVALVILLVACVNFMNLSIGLSISRAKEIGMRKVMGAYKRQLVFQFLSESFLLTLISVIIGVTLAAMLLPQFNELANRQLIMEFSLENGLILLVVVLVVSIGAGFYPAIVLSNFKPLSILRGQLSMGIGRNHMRKIMMVLQFVFSIFLIAATLVMGRQLNYLSDKNLGFNQENRVVVPGYSAGRGIRDMISKGMEQAALYKNTLLQNPDIVGVGISAFTPGTGGWLQAGYSDAGEQRQFQVNFVEEDYVQVNEMELVAGRDFSKDKPSDKTNAIIVNEAFVRDFGLEDPIGRKIPGGSFTSHQIIGVVKDFNFESLHSKVVPVVLTINPDIVFSGANDIGISSRPNPKLTIRVAPQRLASTMHFLETQWRELYPGAPFEFDFLDEQLATQYEEEQHLGKIISTASVLAILIGCLGLFALSKLSIESRSKEIGIRKVLGASYRSILYVFSKGYGLLIVLAFLIATPLTFYLTRDWLESFEYAIALNGIEFGLAGVLTLIIAIVTLSVHSIKVAKTNPATTLRDQ